MGRSVLDDLGQEVTGIVAPVSMCMAITVALVRLLNPEGQSDSNTVYIAQIYYSEDESDSTGRKLSGSLINALIFIGIIGAMTFLLVLMFKYGYTKFIYAYMGFSGFSIFFVLTGIILIQLLQKAGAHMDWISFTFILFNFAAVGAATLFFAPAPLLLKQCYLVVTGVATAFVFTWIPEWTTWVLLVAMALYDILAVLVPGGPLRLLVELAQEREEEIPALVYQARPTRSQASMHVGGSSNLYLQQQQQEQQSQVELTSVVHVASAPLPLLPPAGAAFPPDPAAAGTFPNAPSPQPSQDDGRETPDSDVAVEDPLIDQNASTTRSHSTWEVPATAPENHTPTPHGLQATHASPYVPATSASPRHHLHGDHAERRLSRTSPVESAEGEFGLPDAIKLGLGDFIFYSVLVGRAAMFDWLTVTVCYIAIIAGLGCTLLWLAIAHHALPALPVSIALAVVFYFVGRFVMEPVVLPMTLHLVYF